MPAKFGRQKSLKLGVCLAHRPGSPPFFWVAFRRFFVVGSPTHPPKVGRF